MILAFTYLLRLRLVTDIRRYAYAPWAPWRILWWCLIHGVTTSDTLGARWAWRLVVETWEDARHAG